MIIACQNSQIFPTEELAQLLSGKFVIPDALFGRRQVLVVAYLQIR
jgi:hypothetical protein